MHWLDIPSISLAIARLDAVEAPPDRFAIWVVQAPYPGGYVHDDRVWPDSLDLTWQAWQQLFSLQPLDDPIAPNSPDAEALGISTSASSPGASYSSRLMQQLGLRLWQFLFSGSPIERSFAQSQGIALGQGQPLRVRLDLRDPSSIALPWEIAQPRAGKPAIALAQNLLFSRTTSDVEPLSPVRESDRLKVLVVLGQDGGFADLPDLDLDREAASIAPLLQPSAREEGSPNRQAAPCQVDTLVQPTPGELIEAIETEEYNILLYAGHGTPAPDGGKLWLRPDTTLSGTELAQVLVRARVTLAIFNACWGAAPDRHDRQPIKRSSLAEVLIHHGVPAAIAMRDSIADSEALSFIQALIRALGDRLPIDRAVSVARAQLLTLYKFNQPVWTLPIAYMHPEFDGMLVMPLSEAMTELPPNSTTWLGQPIPTASLHAIDDPTQVWQIHGGVMRVGRRQDNDLIRPERWVSQQHAEIFYRHLPKQNTESTYFLRDFSRYGTLVSDEGGWRKIHHAEIALRSGTRIQFGSSKGQILEFKIGGSDGSEISESR